MKDIKLSIIIPIKDIDYWKNNVIRNVDLFKKYNFEHEFLFVYSSKKDNSIISLQKILKKEKNIGFYLDQGNSIYSAMNKGIESSKGSYLIFIGADDSFNESQISNFIETLNNNLNIKYDLILFEVLFKGETEKRSFWKKEGGITTQIHWTLGQPRIHQGILYKRSFIISKKIRYLSNIKVTADYIFTSEVCSYKPLTLIKNFPIIFYNTDGFSSKSSYSYRLIEHIKGYYLIPRLRKYLFFVIVTRFILLFYKFIFNSAKKLNLIFKNLLKCY